MLGNVARKLRIFGFDTLYVAHVDDSEVLKIGTNEGRVILTADRELFKRAVKARAPGVLVGGSSELDDLVHILEKAGVESVDVGGIGTRCSMCNGILEPVSPDVAQREIAEKIITANREFFRCAACGKFYWEGSHIHQMRALARRIDSMLVRQRN